MAITYRSVKGLPLTSTEIDANFSVVDAMLQNQDPSAIIYATFTDLPTASGLADGVAAHVIADEDATKNGFYYVINSAWVQAEVLFVLLNEYTANKIAQDDAIALNTSAIAINTPKRSYPVVDQTKVDFIAVTASVDLDSLKNQINNFSVSLITGVQVYETFADLPVTGDVTTSYKITNDADASLLGFWHYDGATYIKDATPSPQLGYDLIYSVTDLDNLITLSVGGNWMVMNNITLDGNKTIPSGVTLHFNGGVISGGFTLTGNDTKIEANLVQIFSNITFSGSYRVTEVHPEWFGAVGDGITDEIIEIQKCIELTALTNGGNILLNKKYFISNKLNLTNIGVISKGGEIITNINDYAIEVIGSITTFKNITTNVNKNATFIDISSSDIALLNIEQGDLIKIISNKIFSPASGENITQGEIQRVKKVLTSSILLEVPIEDDYLLTDVPVLAKITSGNYKIQGRLKITQGGNIDSKAIIVSLSDSPNINIEANNAKYSGVYINDCYTPIANVLTYNTDNSGTGYGLSIGNATMYGRFTGVSTGARHAVAVGGGGLVNGLIQGGVSWGNIIYDYIGSMSQEVSYSHVFDTHKSVGSVIYKDCVANGFDNLGHGFSIEALNVDVVNCTAKNLESLIIINGTEINNINLINNKGFNVHYGVSLVNSVVNNLNIDGLYIKNDYDVNDKSILSFSLSTVNNWSLNNMSALGVVRYINISSMVCPNLYSSNIHTRFIDPAFGDATYLDNGFIEHYNNNTEINLSNCSTNAPLFFYNRSGNSSDKLHFINCKSLNPSTYTVNAIGFITKAIFDNCQFNESVYTGYFQGGISELTVTNCILNGITNRGFLVAIGVNPFNKVFESGNTYNNLNNRLLYTENALQHIVSGGMGDPKFILCSGTPEGNQIARVGCLASDTLTGVLYRKTTGTGNTGWVSP